MNKQVANLKVEIHLSFIFFVTIILSKELSFSLQFLREKGG